MHHNIHYDVRGEENRPVLLLHSTGVGSIQWKRFVRRLLPRKCLMLDCMGYPPSDAWKGKGAPDWRVDLEAARAILLAQNSPVDIIGHSYGGHIGLHLAHDHPERVSRLALHEPIAWGILSASGPKPIQADFKALVQRFFPATPLPPEDWLRHFVDYWNAPGVWDALATSRKDAWRQRYPKIFSEVRHLCFDPCTLEYWAEIQHPVLLTLSEHAPSHEVVVCELLNKTLPQCQLKHTPGGHMAPLTHGADVLPLLAAAVSHDPL